MMSLHDPRLHLFVDDSAIYQAYGVARIVNSAETHPEPIIVSSWVPDRMATAWGSVLQEADGRLRMWYLDMDADPHEKNRLGTACADIDQVFMCYAESTDGIHWEKPELGLIEWRGSRANNIVMNGALGARSTDGGVTNFDGFTILRDEAEPDPDKRYKMIAHWESIHLYDRHIHQKEISDAQLAKHRACQAKYLTTSPDGIHWNAPLVRIQETGLDRMLVSRDERHGRWWMSVRPNFIKTPGMGFVRFAGLSYSEDLIHWSMPVESVFAPDAADEYGDAIQFHTFHPFNYGDQDLAFLTTAQMRGQFCECYLASHRDGEPWQRILRDQPIIRRGAPGRFDRQLVVPLHNPPIVVGDEMFVYYSAGASQPSHPAGQRSIGAARLRRDAFVGVAAGGLRSVPDPAYRGDAFLITREATVSGDTLLLNLEKTDAMGRARVALLNPDLSPIPGFTLDDSLPVNQDGVSVPVRWKDHAGPKTLAGRSIRLHVNLANSVLYAYRFGDSEA